MKKKVFNLVLILAMVLAFAAAGPSTSLAASNLVTTVDRAVIQMQKAYHTYSDVTATGKFADINTVYKEYNAAKAAYANAKTAVVKYGGFQKAALLAKLDSNYTIYITKRVIPYIDAYNYITKDLNPLYEDLKAAKANKDLEAVDKFYYKISYQLKERTTIIYRVYGKTTRDLFKEDKDKAQTLRDEFVYDVTLLWDLNYHQIDTLPCDEAPAWYDSVNKYLPYVSDTFKEEFTKMGNQFKYMIDYTCKVE